MPVRDQKIIALSASRISQASIHPKILDLDQVLTAILALLLSQACLFYELSISLLSTLQSVAVHCFQDELLAFLVGGGDGRS